MPDFFLGRIHLLADADVAYTKIMFGLVLGKTIPQFPTLQIFVRFEFKVNCDFSSLNRWFVYYVCYNAQNKYPVDLKIAVENV